MEEKVDFIWKLLIALCGGVFSVAIAIVVQRIKLIGVPKWLVGAAIFIQLLLSWGVFIFVMMFFKSGLLPESVPNDDWSALTCAYFMSAIPHIVVATAILIYNKEVNKWLESRYGKENVPNMENLNKEIQEQEATPDITEIYKEPQQEQEAQDDRGEATKDEPSKEVQDCEAKQCPLLKIQKQGGEDSPK